MTKRLKVKSVNDVITNSSDETYILSGHGGCTETEILEQFETFMKKNYPDEWDLEGCSEYTIIPEVSKQRHGLFEISWDVMCNLSWAEKYLKECFGNNNIQ